MLKTRFEWAVLVVGLALLGTGWIAYSREPVDREAASALTEAPLAGYLAPNFTLPTIEGATFSLSDYRGRPVVLNFWATWCPPCRAEMPHFQDASVKYDGRVAVIGVDQGESLSLVSDFAAGFRISYPLLLDVDSRINQQYGVTSLPTTLFIDSHGIIRETFSGIINAAVLQDRIERLLAEG
jgi:cytochrome c biogenesis protein CcmG, thiol:disulfide interchange protein DsbE